MIEIVLAYVLGLLTLPSYLGILQLKKYLEKKNA